MVDLASSVDPHNSHSSAKSRLISSLRSTLYRWGFWSVRTACERQAEAVCAIADNFGNGTR